VVPLRARRRGGESGAQKERATTQRRENQTLLKENLLQATKTCGQESKPLVTWHPALV